MDELERYKGEIFLLYKIEKKTLQEVHEYILLQHGLYRTVRQLNSKLKEWGFGKYIRKEVAVAVSREKEQRQAAGEDMQFYYLDRPVDMQKVEQYLKRKKINIGEQANSSQTQKTGPDQLVVRTLPQAVTTLQQPQQWFIPWKMFYDIEMLIRRSFERGDWRFLHNERLIESSPTANSEKRCIMHFIGAIDIGSQAAQDGNLDLAGEQWRLAFLEIENLLNGTYHDIIPNLIVKLNDLINWEFPEVASSMMRHISQLCLQQRDSTSPVSLILANLGELSLEHMNGVEDQIMTIFYTIFQVYLGSWCYNSFVAEMNRARRVLNRDEWADLDRWLPNLASLDITFGPTNCRPLDVLRLRVETMFRRGQYLEVVDVARELSQRAERKHNDPWQRHYFLIKAFYFCGSAHFQLGSWESARQSFEYALYLDESFRKIDNSDQFDAERDFMLGHLELMAATAA